MINFCSPGSTFNGYLQKSKNIILIMVVFPVLFWGCASFFYGPGPYKVKSLTIGIKGVVRGLPGTSLSLLDGPPIIPLNQNEWEFGEPMSFEMTYSSAQTHGDAARLFIEDFWKYIHDGTRLTIENYTATCHADVVVEYDEETHSVKKKITNIKYYLNNPPNRYERSFHEQMMYW